MKNLRNILTIYSFLMGFFQSENLNFQIEKSHASLFF